MQSEMMVCHRHCDGLSWGPAKTGKSQKRKDCCREGDLSLRKERVNLTAYGMERGVNQGRAESQALKKAGVEVYKQGRPQRSGR